MTIKTITLKTPVPARVNTRVVFKTQEDKLRAANAGYYGKHSAHFRHTEITPLEIFELTLSSGYAIAPGLYRPDPERAEADNDTGYLSNRSLKTFVESAVYLLDADEWDAECPAPQSLQELLDRYPDLLRWFYYIAESISSQSEKKPELRFRVGLLLPHALRNNALDKETFLVMMREMKQRFPFVAAGVAKDMSRLSYGNAKPGAIYERLPGAITVAQVSDWREQAEKEIEDAAAAADAKAKKDASKRARMSDSGVAVSADGAYRADDPLAVYRAQPLETLLEKAGATHLSGREWHWHESETPHSFSVFEDALSIFSKTMQKQMPPAAEKDEPINGHRFLAYYHYRVDFVTADWEEMEALLSALADDGFREES